MADHPAKLEEDIMRRAGWWSGFVGFAVGCWGGAAEESGAPTVGANRATAVVSPAFVVSTSATQAPPVASIAPLGEGVTLRWSAPTMLPLAAGGGVGLLAALVLLVVGLLRRRALSAAADCGRVNGPRPPRIDGGARGWSCAAVASVHAAGRHR